MAKPARPESDRNERRFSPQPDTMTSSASPIDLSVIIVNWNTASMTLECLESLYANTAACRVEVIVVDNGSQDGSADRIIQTFPNVTLIRNRDNRGFAAASNQGIETAQGGYLLLLNSDTIVCDGVLERLIACLDDHPEVGIVGPRLVDGEGRLQLSARKFPTLRSALFEALHLHMLFPRSRVFGDQLLSWWDHRAERSVDFVEGSSLLVRRVVVDQIGLLDTGYFMYSEDVDWCWRARRAGWTVAYLPEASIIHLGGGSGYRRSPKLALEACKSKIRFHEKCYGATSASLLKFILLLGAALRLARLWMLSTVTARRAGDATAKEKQGLRESIAYLWRER